MADRGTPPSTPRWVKVFGIIVIILVVIFIILKVTGIGGEHGPGRHLSSEAVDQSVVRVETEVQKS
jgi:hypothetical protein